MKLPGEMLFDKIVLITGWFRGIYQYNEFLMMQQLCYCLLYMQTLNDKV